MAFVKGIAAGALAALTLVGCGDALVGEAYRGPVVIRIEAAYSQPTMNVADRGALRVAVFWAPQGEYATDPADLIEQRASTTGVGDGYRVVLTVHDEPDPEHLVKTAAGGVYGVGLLLVYEDANGNDRHDDGEAFVGGAGGHGLFWVPEPLTDETGPRNRAVPAGMHIIQLPTECGRPPNLDQRTPCDVPFHESCRLDAQCGAGGTCDDATPGGQCVLPQRTDMRNCMPPPSQAVFAPELSSSLDSLGTYIKACASNDDCRWSEGYRCDQWLGGCVASTSVGLLVDPERPMTPNICPPMLMMGPDGLVRDQTPPDDSAPDPADALPLP